MPASDIRQRLQRLRVQKVKRDLPPSVRPNGRAGRAAPGLPGQEVETRAGRFHLIETLYPLEYRHGPRPLSGLLTHPPAQAARLAGDAALAQADLRGLAFLDTETTGLAGGAGTVPFLVGVGAFDSEGFRLRQYFLRDPAEEYAMLAALAVDTAHNSGWVTFNGRSFDLPLLETRLVINGQRGALGQRPHLDLLTPSRRLYSGRLESCRLGEIEHSVFHLVREQDDVPGVLIPEIYRAFLRTGDAADMRRVIYHNAMDILSMVTLAEHLLEVFATPLLEAKSPNGEAEDLLRLGRWHLAQGRPPEAEAALRAALAGRLNAGDRSLGLRDLAALLKRQDRRAEAAPLWEQWAAFTVDDPEPFVELAKYYEWHASDLSLARAWTQRALALAQGWPAGWQRAALIKELRRRLERLEEKAA